MNEFVGIQNELGLKAIKWDTTLGKFTSPSHSGFMWERDGIETAKCWNIMDDRKGCKKGGDIPGDDCTCGLYCGFRWNIIGKGYTQVDDICPVCLVETHGKTILYTDGMRSLQQGIVAVVNTWEPDAPVVRDVNIVAQYDVNGVRSTQAASYQAADYFGVPILSKHVATVVMDLQNVRCNTLWGMEEDGEFGYVPESSAVRKMSLDSIIETIEQYIPSQTKQEEEALWSQLFPQPSTDGRG
jgi:hypothetical protein